MVLEPLRIELYGRHVADVEDAGFGLCGLRYTPEARATGAPARLSLSLPVRDEPYAAERGAMRWLRALLPEGRALQAAVEQYEVPADDVFSLLSVLGRDVAGAAIITPRSGEPDNHPPGYRRLADDELTTLVHGVHERPLGLDRRLGVRLSLAGVQDKLVLHRAGRGRWYQPIGGAASTVIVKPEPPRRDGLHFAGLAANEALCLTLARRVGLDAAKGQVITVGGRPCLVVRRYDRVQTPVGVVERLHQEDFLSALGRDPWLKYETGNARRLTPGGGFGEPAPVRSEPGPSLDELAQLVSDHLGRAGLVRLLEVIAFNVVIGNADAHARNLSLLLLPDGGVRLAPVYDLVCTRYFPELDTTAAQRVSGEQDIDAVGIDHLSRHAASWGLPDTVLVRVPRVVTRVLDVLPAAETETIRNGGDPAHVHRVAELIAGRTRRMLAGA